MQLNKYYLGGDPGLTGGLLCIDSAGKYVFHLQYPLVAEGVRTRKVKGVNQKQDIMGIDCGGLATSLKIHTQSTLLSGMGSYKVILEKVWLMKDQGISTGSTFMDNYGRLKAILACFVGEPQLVTPKAWQSALFGKNVEYTKAMGKQFTVDNLSDYKVLIPQGCRVIPDGLSDAYCMAEYLRRTYEQ